MHRAGRFRFSPLCGAILAAACAAKQPAESWSGAWGFPPIPATPPAAAAAAQSGGLPAPEPFHDVTVRQVVRVAAGATRIRIRFSNEFGALPLTIGNAHIAVYDADGAILPGSDHQLYFSGRPGVTIPADAPLLSDVLAWPLRGLTRLAISAYLPGDVTPAAHRLSEYVSNGDRSGADRMPDPRPIRAGALVTGVEVVSSTARHVLVAFGDSITEGFGSTVNEFRGWPDRLAERLLATRATRKWSVVNAGVNSNRLLHNYPGMNGLARFDRDVLAVPGVALVLVFEGLNDIGYSHSLPSEAVTAADIIGAYRQLIARAHGRGVAIVACTITPFEGAHYYSPDGELMRQTVNRWIRGSNAFDGVVDFDAALRDPDRPAQANPSLTGGDHLHPNDRGYLALANAIKVALLAEWVSRAAGR